MEKNIKPIYQQISEANLSELFDLQKKLSLSTESLDPMLFTYITGLIHFHKGDSKALGENVDRLKQIEAPQELCLAQEIRAYLRLGTLNRAHLDAISARINLHNNWVCSELMYTIAMGYLKVEEFQQSQIYFLKVSALLESLGIPRKSMRAYASGLAALTSLYPERRFIAEHQDLIVKAKAVNDTIVESVASINLSREYQKLGSEVLSLEYANKAVQILHDNHHSSREWGLALVHRSEIYLDLKNNESAFMDLEHAKFCPHLEVAAARKIVLARWKDQSMEGIANVLPRWREYTPETLEIYFTEAEIRFIELLVQQPTSKENLITRLFGEKLDFESADNRFRNLLSRIRKKSPQLVQLSQGLFSINDYEQATTLIRRKKV